MQIQTHVPKQSACPDWGGELRKLSEGVSEMLEDVPESFRVIRRVRPKLSWRQCERIVQAPAPSRSLARGLAGPGLLAHVLVSKYADHLPLYRQCEIYERQGIELERSTLADWVGGTAAAMENGSCSPYYSLLFTRFYFDCAFRIPSKVAKALFASASPGASSRAVCSSFSASSRLPIRP